jgi:hypothetical protein
MSDTRFTIVPAGTVIYEPDPIHRVTLQFATAEDAIVFYEWLLHVDRSTFTVRDHHDV